MSENDLHHPELRWKHASRFKRIARSMSKLLEDIREEIPDANMYLEDSGNWHLLSGESHEHVHGRDRMRQDRVLATEQVYHSSGGAW